MGAYSTFKNKDVFQILGRSTTIDEAPKHDKGTVYILITVA